MPRRSANFLAAAVATGLCFAGFVGFWAYAAADENIGAGFVALLFMVATIASAAWCVIAIISLRRRRVEPRGFAVLPPDRGDGTTRAAGGGMPGE